ncbi:MAG: hypothetical protein Q9160_007258 [Pyrenula sp. 1 TL-2023]
MADLGSGRRHLITSFDPAKDKTQRQDRLVTKQDLEVGRAVNLQGTSAAKKATEEKNAEKLAAWNAPPKGWGDDTELENLPNILDGQAHRARLNRESGRDEPSVSKGHVNLGRQPGGSSLDVGRQPSGDARNYLPSARGPLQRLSVGRAPPVANPRGGLANDPGRPTYGDPQYRPLDPALDGGKAPQYSAKQKGTKKGNKIKIDVKLPAHTPRAPRAGPHSTITNTAAKRPSSSTFSRDKLADSSTFLLAANITNQNNADFQKHIASSRQAEPGSKAAKLAAKKKEAVVGAVAASPPTLGAHKITYKPGTLESLSTGSDRQVKPKDEGTDGLLSPKTLSSKIWSGSESTGSRQAERALALDTGKLSRSGPRSDTLSKVVQAESPRKEAQGSNVSEHAASTVGSLVDIEQPTVSPLDTNREKSPMAEDLMDQENAEVTVQPSLTPISPQLDQFIELGNRILYKGNWYILENRKESQQTFTPSDHESAFQSPDSADPRHFVSKAVSIPRSLIGDIELARGRAGRNAHDESGSLAASKWKPDTSRSSMKSESKVGSASVSSVARTLPVTSEDNMTMLQKARQPPRSPNPSQPASFQPNLHHSVPNLPPTISDDQSSSSVDELSTQMAELKVSRRIKSPSKPRFSMVKAERADIIPMAKAEPQQGTSSHRQLLDPPSDLSSHKSGHASNPLKRPMSPYSRLSTTSSPAKRAVEATNINLMTSQPSLAQGNKPVKARSYAAHVNAPQGTTATPYDQVTSHSSSIGKLSGNETSVCREAEVIRASMGLLPRHENLEALPIGFREPTTPRLENKFPQSHQAELKSAYESSSTGYGIQSRSESRYRQKTYDYHLDSESISTKTGGSTRSHQLRAPFQAVQPIIEVSTMAPTTSTSKLAGPPTFEASSITPTSRTEPVVVESRWAPAPPEDLPMPDAGAIIAGNSDRQKVKGMQSSKWATRSSEDSVMADTMPPLANITNSKGKRIETTKWAPEGQARSTQSINVPPSASTAKSSLMNSKWATTKSPAGPIKPTSIPANPLISTARVPPQQSQGPSRATVAPASTPPAAQSTGRTDVWGKSAGGSLQESKWASDSRSNPSARR